MPYNSAGPGSQIPVARIKPITADFIGDATAGGNSNLQTYVDDRRNYRGKVANAAGLSALGALQTGDFALVLDNGSGKSELQVYNASTTSWSALTSNLLTANNTFTGTNAFSNKVTLPTAVSNVVATNLFINSDSSLANYNSKSGVTDAPGTISGFSNAVAFADNAVSRYAYKTNVSLVGGTAYTLSVYVVMDDGSAPVPGAQNAASDFCVILGGGIASTVTVTQISGSLYRISATRSSATYSAPTNSGIIKYTQNSAKPFKITGIQLEVGSSMTDYIATTAAAVTRNEFEATGLLKASNGLTVTGTATATTFSGSGASLTALNATNLSTGTVADARLSSNVALLTGVQTFTGNKTFSGTVTLAADPTANLQAATKQYVDALKPTVVVLNSLSTAHNAVAGSVVLVKLTAAATANIVLPSAATAGDSVIVKDASGNFSTYNVTVTRSGSDTVEGDTSVLLSVNRMSVTFMSDGQGGWWII